MNKQQKRLMLIIGVLAAAGGAVALVLAALGSSVSYFYTPSDIAKLATPPTGPIRLGGLVADGSVSHGEDVRVSFIVRDEFGELPVIYDGVLPDLFREGQGVVVQGRIENGALIASQVLAKHDENYMPKEVADALKEQGRWKESEGAY